MKADEVIRVPGALLHVLKISDGVNLILRPKCCRFTNSDKSTLFEGSNSTNISETNIWGITVSEARSALIIGCHFLVLCPFQL